MANVPMAAEKPLTIWEAHKVAATGSRDRIAAAIHAASGPSRELLVAVLAQHDGHVDSAIASLQRIIRRSSNPEVRAACADFLAPIYMSRHRLDDVTALVATFDEAAREAEAFAFRALVAARKGMREAANRYVAGALLAIDDNDDELLRSRILQRLALTAFYLHDFEKAIERARASAAFSTLIGADRTAATCYTIAYSINHEVTGDFKEASRYAKLWREAATRAGDASMVYAAIAAEYELAVQFADQERIHYLDAELRARPLPQAYLERFSMVISHALVIGAKEPAGMRTVLFTVRDTARSRGERSFCDALIALAYAGERDDDRARKELNNGISRLGRRNAHEPAYEQQYRRIARAIFASCCIMIGDHVHADRIISVREMDEYPGARRFPTLIQSKALDQVDPSLHGVRNVVARAIAMRDGSAIPAGLTATEIEVLQLLGLGWSAIRIARETGRSVNTIYSHTRAILGKLHAARAPEAVAIARSLSIIS